MAKKQPPAPGDDNELVTVKVLGNQAIHEDSGRHLPGETFETTRERAEALGAFVEIVEATA